MSKPEMRKRLASLSFTEKVKILEKLRDRSLAFAASGQRTKQEELIQYFCNYRDTQSCKSQDQ
jgi:hypothetical protein